MEWKYVVFSHDLRVIVLGSIYLLGIYHENPPRYWTRPILARLVSPSLAYSSAAPLLTAAVPPIVFGLDCCVPRALLVPRSIHRSNHHHRRHRSSSPTPSARRGSRPRRRRSARPALRRTSRRYTPAAVCFVSSHHTFPRPYRVVGYSSSASLCVVCLFLVHVRVMRRLWTVRGGVTCRCPVVGPRPLLRIAAKGVW